MRRLDDSPNEMRKRRDGNSTNGTQQWEVTCDFRGIAGQKKKKSNKEGYKRQQEDRNGKQYGFFFF